MTNATTSSVRRDTALNNAAQAIKRAEDAAETDPVRADAYTRTADMWLRLAEEMRYG